MKRFLLFGMLTFSIFTFAQKSKKSELGTIKGEVSTSDGQPAGRISLLLKNSGIGTITDDNGNFEIRKIKYGTYTLLISLAGYSEKEIIVVVLQNEPLYLKIPLQQTYSQLQNVLIESRPLVKYVETKVSASLHLNLPLIEIPQNIQVTSHQLLSDQGLTSMSEASHTVSGIQKVYGGLNDYSLIIRGTDATNNVFRNGIGGYWWNQQEDVAMLEKIEFIKGPAGFMLSATEPGGVINNVTKQPTENIANLDVGYGSYNLKRLTADLGGRLIKQPGLLYRLNAGIHSQDRTFQFGEALRYFICPVIKYQINAKTAVTGEYNYMWGRTLGNNDELPSISGKLFMLPHNLAVADDHTDHLTVSDNYFRMELKHNFNDSWHLQAHAGYIHGRWGGYLLDASSELPVTNDTLYRDANFEDWRNFSKVAQAFIDGKFYTGNKVEHKILAGVDCLDKGLSDANGGTWGEKKFGLYLPSPDYYVSKDALRNFQIDTARKFNVKWIAIYVQDHIKIVRKFIVTLAARFTKASTNSIHDSNIPFYQQKMKFNVLTPRLGFTWLLSDDLSLYTLYDQCFVPQIGDNIQHKIFKPVTGFNTEAGMKGYFFKKKLSLSFSAFKIVKNNTITQDPLYPAYSVQTGQVESKGVDFDMTGNIGPSLIVNANYEYVDAKVTRDEDLNIIGKRNYGTPANSTNLWLKYSCQTRFMRQFAFGIGYQYIGDRNAIQENINLKKFLPEYHLIDATVHFNTEKLSIGLNVYNITNIHYATTGSYIVAINEWRYTPGDQMNFRLNVGINIKHSTKH